ncbi:FAD-dependent oxidoreductase, partial [Pectobacterium brasiliense]|uniref:FAD-dependent oxidoreductase n=1 Tax=Pectobacterium brasiliense TaxID=180957 RepID=UPI001968AED2
TQWFTIPSKALRHAVSLIIEFNQKPLYSDNSSIFRSSFSDILRHADSVIGQQTRMRQVFYERIQCELFSGEASLIDAHTIAVHYPDNTHETLTASNIIIATGSRPYHPAEVDFNHPRIYDSDSSLQLDHEPQHVIIYGAGVIG